jgi:hypothetical protein
VFGLIIHVRSPRLLDVNGRGGCEFRFLTGNGDVMPS